MGGVAGFAAGCAKPMSDSFSTPGIPAEKAADMPAELFPGSQDAFDDSSFNVAVQAPEGHTLAEPEYSRAVDALVADLVDTPQMSEETVPLVVEDGAKLSDEEYAATQAGTIEQLKNDEVPEEQPPIDRTSTDQNSSQEADIRMP